ncbi:MAG: hypothetical protein UU77_C0019G0004 [candidate division WWE3 bacterium GW2011_GWC1_41_7]|jgi:hypothetical protein|uniref:Uncharacterized protein n=4 Tax=Katanobacteria TaxID=422282 RepID=A0A0G0ZF82_UNCKA|nr:MAG: hypothetical protein UU72_C0013G0010 [candidate division WWE3 bacterium GW2011_GWB1_41_6]KKS20696.1 MAG: hypothetical protein UU77_C0019G0004 [candidate division WWE3 bacterium GW2011_GWC1_41_7]KKS21935.1 MAG: hypothetical protein UU80_C0017G0036 [candidate division WWE3 bacterium GW2011_GWA1_41_8]OGC57396.1 MAG: hypothetical protein A2976_04235 [candidate division WWE3 bacterium RIFCSPLOWO2_01_FULL_41_9]
MRSLTTFSLLTLIILLLLAGCAGLEKEPAYLDGNMLSPPVEVTEGLIEEKFQSIEVVGWWVAPGTVSYTVEVPETKETCFKSFTALPGQSYPVEYFCP